MHLNLKDSTVDFIFCLICLVHKFRTHTEMLHLYGTINSLVKKIGEVSLVAEELAKKLRSPHRVKIVLDRVHVYGILWRKNAKKGDQALIIR